ncbi:MAG: exodeoxyribonuclease VII small subunit [Oscillospiraceae bacterium]
MNNFEDNLKKLEEIISSLEKGDLSLEKSIEMYENGVKITAGLNRQLKEAKLKIDELSKNNQEA